MITEPKRRLNFSARTNHGAITSIDSRVMMRGARPYLLWSGFLIFLIGLCLIVYSSAFSATYTASSAQHALNSFTVALQGCLVTLILLIAPGLASASVSMERQRRTFDLIFSAPVSPLAYVFGKLMSSYRTVWLLLGLSLPVVATGYLMGGATWVDIIVTFLLISLNALVLGALAIAVSCANLKPIYAIVTSYLVCFIYEVLVSAWAAAGLSVSSLGTSIAPGSGLSAYFAGSAAAYTTKIGAIELPIWVPALVWSLVLTGWSLLGASSALTRFNSRETKIFRLVTLAQAAIYGWAFYGVGASWSTPVALGFLTCFAALTIPFSASFDHWGERKFQNHGWFNPRIWVGQPSTAVPFYSAIIVFGFLGTIGLPFTLHPRFEQVDVYFLCYAICLVCSVGLVTRRLSTWLGNYKAARMVTYALLIVTFVLPPIVLTWFLAAGAVANDAFKYLPISYFGLNISDVSALSVGLALVASVTVLLVTLEILESQRRRRMIGATS